MPGALLLLAGAMADACLCAAPDALALGAAGLTRRFVRRSEVRRARARESLRRTIEKDAEPVFLTSHDGTLLFANRAGQAFAQSDAASAQFEPGRWRMGDLFGQPGEEEVLFRMARLALREGYIRGELPGKSAGQAAGAVSLAVYDIGGETLLWRVLLSETASAPRPEKETETEAAGDDPAEAALRHPPWATAPVGIMLIDGTGRITACNGIAGDLIGADGAKRALQTFIAPEDRAVAEEMIRAASDGASPQPLMVRFLAHTAVKTAVKEDAAGAERPLRHIQLYVRPFRPAPPGRRSAADSRLSAFLIDANEQARLEAQFVQSQKMHAIGQLAGGVAHDFNNLLTAIGGHADLLLVRHEESDPDYAELAQIRQNVNRAAGLVAQLLAFSRRQTLQPKIFAVPELFSELTHLLHRLLGERITLTCRHESRKGGGSDTGFIRVDKGQFEQVIINLAVNARDAMEGSGRILIRTALERRKSPHDCGKFIMAEGEYVLIEIIDSGPGLPEVEKDRLFEPFFTTKLPKAGTGLGLSTVYGIVKQTGGYIFAENVPEGGAAFRMYLPRHEAPQAQPDAPSRPGRGESAADFTGGDKLVMLAEDEDAVRAFARTALARQGYEVIAVPSGDEALSRIRESGRRFDLLISDVVMPGMNGTELAQAARLHQPGLPVILVSGYADDVFRGEAEMEDEGIAFLQKPFSLKDLLARTREAIEGTSGVPDGTNGVPDGTNGAPLG